MTFLLSLALIACLSFGIGYFFGKDHDPKWQWHP
jgi:hypothetical protein